MPLDEYSRPKRRRMTERAGQQKNALPLHAETVDLAVNTRCFFLFLLALHAPIPVTAIRMGGTGFADIEIPLKVLTKVVARF